MTPDTLTQAPVPRAAPRAERWLPLVLRLTGASFVLFFIGGMITSVAGIEFPQPFRGWVQWDVVGNAEEQMLSAVYIAWGVFLWISARDPLRHRLFLDFTVAANAAHFLTMLVQGIAIDGEHSHLLGDVLFGWATLIVLAAAWLPVRKRIAGRLSTMQPR